MLKREFFQKILLLLAPKLRHSLLFSCAMIFGFMSAPQTMDRPPHRDTDPHKAKHHTMQEPSPSLERNGLTVILLNHLEIEAAAESLNNVEISSPSSNKKRSLSTLESQTHKEKKARSKEAANEIILSHVCRMFPQEARPQVLQFMELPNMLINLIKGADIPQNHIRYWEPIIAQHIPELKGYLRGGKKEKDVPACP